MPTPTNPDSCVVQPTGISYSSTPDTDTAFLADEHYSDASLAGYAEAFDHLQAVNNALEYLGFSLMSSCDPSICAARCDKVIGCQAMKHQLRKGYNRYECQIFATQYMLISLVDPDGASSADYYVKKSYVRIRCVY